MTQLPDPLWSYLLWISHTQIYDSMTVWKLTLKPLSISILWWVGKNLLKIQGLIKVIFNRQIIRYLILIKKALFISIKLCTETCMLLLPDATTIKLQFIKGDIFIKVSCFQNEFFFIMDCISIFTFMYLSTNTDFSNI